MTKHQLHIEQKPNKRIWTLPTSSEESFSFALVVSAVAFVYPACFGLFALANL